MTFYCLGLYGGGDYYVIPEEGLCNNLLLHSGPIFSLLSFHITGRIQFKVLPSCLAKSSDFGSTFLKYYVNVQVFNVLLK